MSSTPPDFDDNPYAAPESHYERSEIEPTHSSEAEEIRRKFLSHEASVKSIGWLNYFGAAISAVIAFAAGGFALGIFSPPANRQLQAGSEVVFGIVAGIFLVVAVIIMALGIGIRRLKPWARWTELIFAILNTIALVFRPNLGLLFSVAIIYLMVSPKSNTVFSDDYKRVIAATPHIRYKTNGCVIALLVILVLVLGLAFFSYVMSRR